MSPQLRHQTYKITITPLKFQLIRSHSYSYSVAAKQKSNYSSNKTPIGGGNQFLITQCRFRAFATYDLNLNSDWSFPPTFEFRIFVFVLNFTFFPFPHICKHNLKVFVSVDKMSRKVLTENKNYLI